VAGVETWRRHHSRRTSCAGDFVAIVPVHSVNRFSLGEAFLKDMGGPAMSSKNRDQKRKDKLAKRTERQRERQRNEIQPYEGKKYQSPQWTPHVYQTELAIYETIILSGRRLTNEQVRAALTALVLQLRGGQSALLGAETQEMRYAPGAEMDFLIWNIRRHWGILFDQQGIVNTEDLIGILRALLYSIEAHAWNTGRDRGYVAFLYGFLGTGIS
jgi:hypothetical protein